LLRFDLFRTSFYSLLLFLKFRELFILSTTSIFLVARSLRLNLFTKHFSLLLELLISKLRLFQLARSLFELQLTARFLICSNTFGTLANGILLSGNFLQLLLVETLALSLRSNAILLNALSKKLSLHDELLFSHLGRFLLAETFFHFLLAPSLLLSLDLFRLGLNLLLFFSNLGELLFFATTCFCLRGLALSLDLFAKGPTL